MSIDIGVLQPIKFLRNFDAQALNPQPLPPKELGFQLFGNLNSRALNPQPLPPNELSKLFGNLFNSRLLNPQPLPSKGEAAFAAWTSNPVDAVALNPQPLPPQGETAFSAGLGPILEKIKALVKPLLDKVLQKAIG